MAEKPENPKKFKWVQEVSQDGSIKYRPNYEVFKFKPPPSEIIEARVRSSLSSNTATSSSFAVSSSYASYALSASYAVSASHEIVKEISSSYADTASFAQSGDGIFSGSFSGSYEGDGSQLTGISTDPFPFVGDAVITGSLTITGSFNAFKLNANNVVLGPDAGTSLNAGGLNNVILGNSAASNLTTGDNNVIIGTNAGDGVGTGGSNVAIGRNAGFSALGNRSVLVGDQAGTQGGTDNVFLGYQAGAVGTGNYNVAIGTTALRGNSGGSNYSVAIGYEAGYRVGAGDDNILIGRNSGDLIVTGNANIIIGSGSQGASALERQLRIGHSDNIIISASLETGDIIFASTASAAYFVGDGSQLTNLPIVTSASYASTASYVNPLVQAVIITGSLYVTGSNGNIDSNAGILYDSSGISSLKYAQRGLYASNNTLSVAYNTRRLYRNDGTSISFDWEAGDLNDNSGTLAIDLGERKLHDRFGTEIGRFTTTGTAYFSGSLIGTSSWAENVTSASFALTGDGVFSGSFSGSFEGNGSGVTGIISSSYTSTASYAPSLYSENKTIGTSRTATITDSLTWSGGQEIRTTNSRIYREVTQASELPTTLVANTTYIIKGEITISSNITCTVEGVEITGIDRNLDHIIWSGTGALLTVTDVNFGLNNVRFSSTQAGNSILVANNVAASGYNNGRLKVLTIFNCQFRGTYDVMDINGFDLVDINNTLFFYIRATNFGLRFRDVSKLEMSSCEIIRWFDESTIPTPSGYSTVSMVELQNNNLASFGAVNINGCIIHPQQTQNGIDIGTSSTTGFGTISSNAFVTVGLTTGEIFLPIASGLPDYSQTATYNYDIFANQGVLNSVSGVVMTLNGNTTNTALSSGLL